MFLPLQKELLKCKLISKQIKNKRNLVQDNQLRKKETIIKKVSVYFPKTRGIRFTWEAG